MTRWIWIGLLPGGSLVLAWRLARWLLRRHQANEARKADALIGRPVYRPGFEVADDSLRIQSKRRREAAADIRREAVRIETGAESEQRIKLRRV